MKTERNLAFGLMLVLAFIVGVLAPATGKSVSAQSGPQGQGPTGNGWRTLVQLPTDVSLSFVKLAVMQQSSGDWAVYTTADYACNHNCLAPTEIHLKHLLD